jgi:nucleoside-diphosphate-sugar epimerase
MRWLVTGANGFVGRALVRRLLSQGLPGGRALTQLAVTDFSLDECPADPRLLRLPGDLTRPDTWSDAFTMPLDGIVHLASVPGGTAEAQPALARAVNLDATQSLLDHCQALTERGGGAPRFVFASTIAVYGAALPPEVTDQTPAAPHMVYGAHKLMAEIAVAHASRRGWIDGVSLRLPGILVRPPAPTGQLSAFLSNFIRELAHGRPFECPTSPGATTWASSLSCVVDNLLHAAVVDAERLPPSRSLLLPTLRLSMTELADAIGRVHAVPAQALVRWSPDEHIETLFGKFPPLRTTAAEGAGFVSDGDGDTLVRRALEPA